MLPRRLRLPARHQQQTARKIATEFFVASIAKNNLETNRYGFVVSKKVSKKAVVRNRLKRVLRSCVEELHEKLTVGYDMLFIVKKDFYDLKREQVFQEVTEALKDYL